MRKENRCIYSVTGSQKDGTINIENCRKAFGKNPEAFLNNLAVKMKITILEKKSGEEDELIVKCDYLDENLSRLINQFKGAKGKMNFYKDSKIVFVDPCDILYFESVDDNVFAYTKECVYETKLKLYQLEQQLPQDTFFRANKAVIVNLDKIDSLTPVFGGRFEALLQNGYKVVVSRNYLNTLKELLGL